MKIGRIFRSTDLSKPKKLAALKKILEKLKKKKTKLEAELATDISGKRKKKISARLEANKRHRRKAEKLIAEFK